MVTRTEKITFRMTPKEKEQLKKKVAASSLKMEPFIRALIAGKEINERPPDGWAEAVRQLSAIGNNINQIARIANTNGIIDISAISEIQNMHSEIWRMVKNL